MDQLPFHCFPSVMADTKNRRGRERDRERDDGFSAGHHKWISRSFVHRSTTSLFHFFRLSIRIFMITHCVSVYCRHHSSALAVKSPPPASRFTRNESNPSLSLSISLYLIYSFFFNPSLRSIRRQ